VRSRPGSQGELGILAIGASDAAALPPGDEHGIPLPHRGARDLRADSPKAWSRRSAKWIDRFSSHLAHERRMSVHTIAAYRHDLRSLAEFGDRRGLERLGGVRPSARCETFAAALHGKVIGARSIQRRMSAARTFYEFLMREGHCERNPADDVRAPKAKKRLPSTLDADQMGRLLAFSRRRHLVRARQGHHGIVLLLGLAA